jgi:hypothetical protein
MRASSIHNPKSKIQNTKGPAFEPEKHWQENRALIMACCLECFDAKHIPGKKSFSAGIPTFDFGF